MQFQSIVVSYFSTVSSAAPIGRGMQLGSKSKTNNILETIKADEGIQDLPDRIFQATSQVVDVPSTTVQREVSKNNEKG